MDLILPAEVSSRIETALRRARWREIGGILMGEALGPDCFRIAEATIQPQGGSFSSFLRNVRFALDPLRRFFSKTGHDYRRFNYLGEWHSHPSFVPEPSGPDKRSMLEIVEDPRVGAIFAVLMIVRLGTGEELDGTVTVFVPGAQPFRGNLIFEAGPVG
jgi:[CysO sulfur-carrier protein]-S-L-cysteine hydrolase